MGDFQARTPPSDPFGWVGGTIDGKYLVERVVGEGGFGVVYRATDLTLQQPVAIKFLKLGRAVNSLLVDRFLENFRKEGQLLRHLSRATTGIVQAHAIGAAISPNNLWSAYLVLEWLDGRTLAQDFGERQERGIGGRSVVEAIDLFEPVAHALRLAHEEGVVHRDLKPENLFLAQVGGRVILKVLDFGIAKVMGKTLGLTPANAVTGVAPRAFTAAYGAPEQFEPVLGATGPWTDVYALALVFLETVSGRRAYTGGSREQLQDEAIDPERRPSFVGMGVSAPEAVEQVMRRALAVDPRNRHPTAGIFWDDLRLATRRKDSIPAGRRAVTEPASTPEPRPVAAARQSVGTTSPVAVGPGTAVATHVREIKVKAAPRSSFRWRPHGLVLTLGLLLAGFAAIGLHSAASHADRAPEDMVLVLEGQYTIGSPLGDVRKCEAPQRQAYVLPFFIDKTEVPVRDYRRCQTAGKCSSTKDNAVEQKPWKGLELCNALRAERGERVEDNPMNCVGRGQAAAYCAFVGKRLPTDEEWEAAARGPEGSEYPWGNAPPSCDSAVFGRPPGNVCPGRGTASVASKRASALGLFDLAGNVWEWTSTSCPNYTLAESSPSSSQTFPDVPRAVPSPTNRQEAEIARLTRKLAEETGGSAPEMGTLRGGGFEWSADNLRAWKRLPWRTSNGGVSTGFRCANDAE